VKGVLYLLTIKENKSSKKENKKIVTKENIKSANEVIKSGVKIADGIGSISTIVFGVIISLIISVFVLILLLLNMIVGGSKLDSEAFTKEEATTLVNDWNKSQDSILFEVGPDQVIYGRYDFGKGDILEIGEDYQSLTLKDQEKKLHNFSSLVDTYGGVPTLIIMTENNEKVLVVKEKVVYFNFFADIIEKQ
jgi:hypothetical protein